MEYPVKVTVAPAEARGKSRETAVTMTPEPMGGVAGALYNPLELIVPKVAFPPLTIPCAFPTYQSTFMVVVPVTVDVNVFVFSVPDGIVQVVGEIVTVGAGRIVTVEEAVKAGSSYSWATTMTVPPEGTAVGAW